MNDYDRFREDNCLRRLGKRFGRIKWTEIDIFDVTILTAIIFLLIWILI